MKAESTWNAKEHMKYEISVEDVEKDLMNLVSHLLETICIYLDNYMNGFHYLVFHLITS